MSAQTDCEMLSIEVMEAYAGKYNLSGNKVVELFQKNQVFEKMLIQHEYLHQVSFEEVMEFVEKLGLEIKHDYQLFRIQRNCKSKQHRRGRKIDFVGRCFGIRTTTIRKRRALALMRQSRYIRKIQKRNGVVSFRMAAGFLSRCSCFKHTDSLGMKKKYYDTVKIRKLKEVVRNESKRKCLSRNPVDGVLPAVGGVCRSQTA